jgi:hypothetical protein
MILSKKTIMVEGEYYVRRDYYLHCTNPRVWAVLKHRGKGNPEGDLRVREYIIKHYAYAYAAKKNAERLAKVGTP